ncbi:MAG: helix-turn-helix domain-containing protein [Cohaesibacteraceae bacterium]|nr:helix-turn-helix domain-containing protein [Cohaesibacteraceae bacterium]MBL4787458.1 helix-turn-helix domain-containing protein [Cohaesibacteraceae bacterium]
MQMNTTLMSCKITAEYLNLSVSTLAKMRLAGTSPKFVKMGRRVAFRIQDIDQWIESRLRCSTSDHN